MLTKEKLLEIMTTATSRFNDALAARTDKAYEAIVSDDTCGSAGYSPYLLGGIGAGRRWIGARVYTTLRSMGVRFDMEKWEKTVEVGVTELADNPAYASGTKLGTKLAESWALTDAKAVQSLLATNAIGFDGVELFGDHEYLDQNADGTVKVHPVGHADEGEPVVLATYNNDMGGSGAAWYIGSKDSILRITREGEDVTVGVKGGTPESSEHTFDNDTVVMGWRARKLYKPGLAFNTVRSKQTLNEENFQAALDRFTTFVNDAGELVGTKPTHLIVKRGTAAATAAKRILGRQLVDGGDTNVYYQALQLLELDYV